MSVVDTRTPPLKLGSNGTIVPISVLVSLSKTRTVGPPPDPGATEYQSKSNTGVDRSRVTTLSIGVPMMLEITRLVGPGPAGTVSVIVPGPVKPATSTT